MDEKRSSSSFPFPPALYFVMDGSCYLVNHTMISKICFPKLLSGSLEPPSAFICWPGLQMRW
jgi:hypothetical protein